MTMNKITAQSRSAQRKKGFTLTEIAIVLGIMGLILGAVWTAASGVYSNQRSTHAKTDVLTIMQGVRSLYGSQPTTGLAAATDITYAMLNAGVIPSDLTANASPIVAGTQANGPFSNGLTGVIGTSDGLGFVISMSAVPQANCVSLISEIAGSTRDVGLYTAHAVANAAPAVGDATTTGTPLTAVVTPVAAGTAPTGAAPNLTGGCTAALNKVEFGFSVH